MDKILEILEEIECNPGGNDLVKCAAEIREIVRPEGRREVVEWLEGKFTKVTGNLVKPYRFINEDDWQARAALADAPAEVQAPVPRRGCSHQRDLGMEAAHHLHRLIGE